MHGLRSGRSIVRFQDHRQCGAQEQDHRKAEREPGLAPGCKPASRLFDGMGPSENGQDQGQGEQDEPGQIEHADDPFGGYHPPGPQVVSEIIHEQQDCAGEEQGGDQAAEKSQHPADGFLPEEQIQNDQRD